MYHDMGSVGLLQCHWEASTGTSRFWIWGWQHLPACKHMHAFPVHIISPI